MAGWITVPWITEQCTPTDAPWPGLLIGSGRGGRRSVLFLSPAISPRFGVHLPDGVGGRAAFGGAELRVDARQPVQHALHEKGGHGPGLTQPEYRCRSCDPSGDRRRDPCDRPRLPPTSGARTHAAVWRTSMPPFSLRRCSARRRDRRTGDSAPRRRYRNCATTSAHPAPVAGRGRIAPPCAVPAC